MKPRAIVVGSGAGGATAARELQGTFDVTVLEAGGSFGPLSFDLRTIERLKRSRYVRPEADPCLLPRDPARRTREGMVLVNGSCVGGTTTIATGNGLRMDDDLRALGLDLDEEFDEIAHEIPVSTAHQRGWHATTRRLFDVFDDLGLDPMPIPKMGDPERCRHCGRCVLGCPEGASGMRGGSSTMRSTLGARVITRSRVDRLVIEHGATAGLIAREGIRQTVPPGRPRRARGRRLRDPAHPRTIWDRMRPDALRRSRPHRRRPAIARVAVQGDRDAVRRTARRLHPVSLLRLPELPAGIHLAGALPATSSA